MKDASISAPLLELAVHILTTIVSHKFCHLQGLELALIEVNLIDEGIRCIRLADKRYDIHVPTELVSENECIVFTVCTSDSNSD
jgi:hypothetical protein